MSAASLDDFDISDPAGVPSLVVLKGQKVSEFFWPPGPATFQETPTRINENVFLTVCGPECRVSCDTNRMEYLIHFTIYVIAATCLCANTCPCLSHIARTQRPLGKKKICDAKQLSPFFRQYTILSNYTIMIKMNPAAAMFCSVCDTFCFGGPNCWQSSKIFFEETPFLKYVAVQLRINLSL